MWEVFSWVENWENRQLKKLFKNLQNPKKRIYLYRHQGKQDYFSKRSLQLPDVRIPFPHKGRVVLRMSSLPAFIHKNFELAVFLFCAVNERFDADPRWSVYAFIYSTIAIESNIRYQWWVMLSFEEVCYSSAKKEKSAFLSFLSYKMKGSYLEY